MPPKTSSTRRPRSKTRRAALGLVLVLLVAAGGTAWWGYHKLERMPGELLRYAEHRLYGHTKLESVFLPLIALARSQVERAPPPDLPTLGKGAQARPLPPVRYVDGRPLETQLTDPTPAPHASTQVASLDELQRAMREARPGAVIELLPGRYTMRRNLSTPVPGRADAPITVRAAAPQTTQILSSAEEGFVVNQPYWVFENLTIQGVCGSDGDCEHAFHVVGAARGTVIRNNRLLDFNAQIKVNGAGGQYPDDGLLQFNTLDNSRPRKTHLPVTPFDLVAASRWVVADNVVANFHKAQGNGVSYGLFMKGGGSHGRIERNLVLCSRQDISAPGDKPGTGSRVGISLGGGGTGKGLCRTSECASEHLQGAVLNNVVAHCSDAGLDVNGSERSVVAHNSLINTGWIDVRNSPASATVYGNWLEGRIRARNGGWLQEAENETRALARWTSARDALDLRWTEAAPQIPTSRAVPTDFCGRARGPMSPPGAIGADGPVCGSHAAQ